MPVASAARELTPPSDDDGLRTALRNVPLLPAPANVDDLLARLDAEAPVASGRPAQAVSEPRHAPPVWGGLWGVGALGGALLTVWNALLGGGAAPPQSGAPAMETAAADDLA